MKSKLGQTILIALAVCFAGAALPNDAQANSYDYKYSETVERSYPSHAYVEKRVVVERPVTVIRRRPVVVKRVVVRRPVYIRKVVSRPVIMEKRVRVVRTYERPVIVEKRVYITKYKKPGLISKLMHKL